MAVLRSVASLVETGGGCHFRLQCLMLGDSIYIICLESGGEG